MSRHITKASAPSFAAIVSGGLIAVVLVFFAVQANPVVGWILWVLTIAGVITGAWLWYRNEFAAVQSADDENRVLSKHKEECA